MGERRPWTTRATRTTRSHLHDAPPAMAVALIVLALGSVVAGWAGIGGRFEHFLEPSFGAVSAATRPPKAGRRRR